MEKLRDTYSAITYAVFLILVLLLGYFARYVLIGSIIGVGIGVLIVPVLNFFRWKLRLSKAVAVSVVFLGMTLIGFIVFGSLFYMLSDQMDSLLERIPVIIESLDRWASKIFDRYPWVHQQVKKIDFTGSLDQGVFSVFKGLKLGVIALGSGLFALVIGLYTAVDAKHLYASSVEAFPPRYRAKAKSVLEDCADVLRGWFRAQLIDMAIIGALTAIGLWIAGVEYWALFGLLTAALGIIPYIGIMIVVVVAMLITLTSDPSKIPWIMLVFMITQQLEGNVILPLVMKGKAELPVVPLLIFMVLLGTFFGIIGVFLAPPLFAVLRTLYIDLYLAKIESV